MLSGLSMKKNEEFTKKTKKSLYFLLKKCYNNLECEKINAFRAQKKVSKK